MSENVIVRMEHVRKAKYCSAGSRTFCERHGIDWADFLKNGIPAETLEATADAMAIYLCEVARGRK